mmetsp:Transcript_24339/g.50977  ORF Transcript_24339/g.50977 Transcript_24339/m.50977 type:complete len:285 (+) Transcript_24339:88-942(+)
MKLNISYLLIGSVVPATARVGVDRFLPKNTEGDTCDNITFNGNGFPSGKTLFKFNILGRDVNKWGSNFNPKGDNAIVVALNGRSDILLLNGDASQDNSYDPRCAECGRGNQVSDFCILDANAIDGDAELCVADPFPSDEPCNDEYDDTCDEPAEYAIFARTSGKGNASAGLCVEIDGDENCYVGSTAISSKKATDISQQLLTLCIPQDDGKNLKVGLFDAICADDEGVLGPCKGQYDQELEETYLWAYDNDNNRRAEFRFYSVADLQEATGTDCFGVTRGGAVC